MRTTHLASEKLNTVMVSSLFFFAESEMVSSLDNILKLDVQGFIKYSTLGPNKN